MSSRLQRFYIFKVFHCNISKRIQPGTIYSDIMHIFYRAMLRRARYCYGKWSLRLSVRKYRDIQVLEIFKNNFTVS